MCFKYKGRKISSPDFPLKPISRVKARTYSKYQWGKDSGFCCDKECGLHCGNYYHCQKGMEDYKNGESKCCHNKFDLYKQNLNEIGRLVKDCERASMKGLTAPCDLGINCFELLFTIQFM